MLTDRKAADEVRRADTAIEFVADDSGPQSIEYHYHQHKVTDFVLRKVMSAEKDGFDSVIVGCFFDTALREAR